MGSETLEEAPAPRQQDERRVWVVEGVVCLLCLALSEILYAGVKGQESVRPMPDVWWLPEGRRAGRLGAGAATKWDGGMGGAEAAGSEVGEGGSGEEEVLLGAIPRSSYVWGGVMHPRVRLVQMACS